MHEDNRLEALIEELYDANMVRFGSFKLKSGIMSPFYFDLRPIISFPKLLSKLADAYIIEMEHLKFDRITGIPFTGLPIATAISMRGNYPMVYCREKAKDYGTKNVVEGIHKAHDKLLVIDDTITDGASKLESIGQFTESQFIVEDVLIFLDRKQGGREKLKENFLNLISVCDIDRLLDILHKQRKIDDKIYSETTQFFKSDRR